MGTTNDIVLKNEKRFFKIKFLIYKRQNKIQNVGISLYR